MGPPLTGRQWPIRLRLPTPIMLMTSRIHALACLLLPLFTASVSNAAQSAMVLPWNDATDTVTSLAGWSHRPAGKKGRLYANDAGELMAGDERYRLWGVNLTGGACFPSHEDAEQVAARMAKYGINVVRFHHMNANWTGTDTLINYSLGNSRTLRPSTLDRLDYLIHQLKEKGIYSNLNLLVSRVFYPADGLPAEIAQVGWKESHTIGHFNDHHLFLQKEFATQLLTHVNPYTGLAYKDDPAIAMVEILNENSLFKAWYSGDLDGWPAVFQGEVTPVWNAWLAGKYASTEALKAAWEFLEEPLGADTLTNGDLRLGTTSGWYLEQHQGATGTMQRVADAYQGQPALRVTVTKTGTASRHIQPKYTPVSLVEDQLYTLRFAARGGSGQSLNLSISRNYDPWSSVGVGHTLELTSEWQEVEITFLARLTDNNLRIACNGFATTLGWVEIAGLSLRTGGTMGEFPPGASLESATIPWPRLVDNGGGAPEAMMRDWFRLMLDREMRYIAEMETHIRDTIGYPGLLLSTQMGYAPAEALAGLSAADGHAYWDHPQFPGSGWDPYNWFINNTSMVNSPPGTLGSLAQRRVAGIPYSVSEYQHAYPNVYATEGPILVGAYAALQNWDGIYFFNYGNSRDDWARGYFNGYFDISVHPGAMANLLIGAALFRRGDVRPAEIVYTYPSPTERYFDELLGNTGGGWVSAVNEFDFDRKSALVSRLSIDPANVNGSSGTYPPDSSTSVHASDTGELTWDTSVAGKGYVRIDTAMTKAFVGFVNGRSFDIGGVILSPQATSQDWLPFGLMAVEGNAILSEAGSRCLLIATGECGNTGMQWNTARTSLVNNNWGHSPSLAEVIPATVDLPVAVERVRAWVLDETGSRTEELAVTAIGEGCRLSIGLPWQTLWYEVEIAPVPAVGAVVSVETIGESMITAATFSILSSMDAQRLVVQASDNLNDWITIPEEQITFSQTVEGIHAVVTEPLSPAGRKFYRAFMQQ